MPKTNSLDPYLDRKKAIGAWMVAGMHNKGLTQVDLAKLTGIPRTTISCRIRDPGSIKDSEMYLFRQVIGEPAAVADLIRSIQ